MTFDEVVRYLEAAVGHGIDVHAWPDREAEIGVHLAGVVTGVTKHEVGGQEPRYFCQIGDEKGNGFFLSPVAFRDAGMALADPETLGLFIGLDGDWQLVIEDDRFSWEEGAPLPG